MVPYRIIRLTQLELDACKVTDSGEFRRQKQKIHHLLRRSTTRGTTHHRPLCSLVVCFRCMVQTNSAMSPEGDCDPPFKLDMADLDPTEGSLASSQKAKLDKMKAWDNNPLKAYECRKKKNQNYYYLVAKDNQLVCAGCKSSRVNKSCSMVRCKNCCIKHCLEEGKVCKCKDHQKGMKERKQKALERCADAGIYDEDCIEAMIGLSDSE